MNLSYKARRRLKNLAIGLCAALVVALLILILTLNRCLNFQMW